MGGAMKYEKVLSRLVKELHNVVHYQNVGGKLQLTSAQENALHTCQTSLGDTASLPRQRRSERNKAKKLLTKLYETSKVLLLVFIFAIPAQQRFYLKETIVPRLQTWIASVTIPAWLEAESMRIVGAKLPSLAGHQGTT
ncbi:hypothetical protein BDV33DRAFT_69430 [Aspergillus novoparasiticus]|uniref:Uncharacterized protein n=1 Tax=Aspergillus novoparasiticus TaxID=986946 RepID=A0A5N6E6U6_9EURO|nr:hypothetical protein BDV33DRAFT_69430 [Aspergillus novoparasiticus]